VSNIGIGFSWSYRQVHVGLPASISDVKCFRSPDHPINRQYTEGFPREFLLRIWLRWGFMLIGFHV